MIRRWRHRQRLIAAVLASIALPLVAAVALAVAPTNSSFTVSGTGAYKSGSAIYYRSGAGVSGSLTLTGTATGAAAANFQAGYASAVDSTPNLRAYWRLGETTGTSAKEMTGAYNGTYVKSPTLGATGAVSSDADKAVTFTGTGGKAVNGTTIGNVSGAFTVETWAKPTAPTGGIVGTRTSGADFGFDMTLVTGKIHADVGTGTAWLSTAMDANYTYASSTWYHIAYVIAPGSYTIYLNGAQVGSGTLPAGTPVLTNATRAFGIGGINVAGATPFTGTLDEVAVFARALTATEISNHYAARAALTGWTPTPAVPAIDTTSPYSVNWAWAAGTSSSALISGRMTDAAGLADSPQAFTVTPDSAGPTVTWTSPAADTFQSSTTSFTTTWTEADSGSGVATRSGQWQSATLSNGSCGSFSSLGSSFTPSAGTTTSPSLSAATCYRLALTLTDNVGNTGSSTSPVTKVDTTAPSVAISNSVTGAGYAASPTATTIYFRPAGTGSVTLTSSGTDLESGIASSTFSALSAPTGWTYTPGTVTGNPTNKTLTWSGPAGSATVDISTTNAAGMASGATTVSLVADSTAPSISALLPAAGTASQTSTTVDVSWAETEGGSGVATRALQRMKATATDSSQCAGAIYAADGASQDVPSPKSETGLAGNACYQWTLILTDRVGNASAASTTGIVFVVDTTPPAPGAIDLATASDSGPLTAEPRTVRIRPDSDTYGNPIVTPSGPAYAALDDVALNQSDYVTGASGATWAVGFSDPVLDATDVVTSVTIVANLTNGAPAGNFDVQVRGPAGAFYTVKTVGQNPSSPVTITVTTRPWDLSSWTKADIEGLEVGFKAATSFNSLVVHRLYVDASYLRFTDEGLHSSIQTVATATGHAGVGGGAYPPLTLAPQNFDVDVDTTLNLTISYTGPGDDTVKAYLICDNRTANFNDDAMPSTSQTNYVKSWTATTARWVNCNIQFTSYYNASAIVTSGTLVYDDGVFPFNAITAPYRFDNITNDSTPSFTGTYTGTVTSIRLFDGTTLVGTDSAPTGGTWAITASTITDGVHSLNAKAVSAGGTSTASPALSVTVDTSAPAAPSVPDLYDAADTGVSSTDNITTARGPDYIAPVALATGIFPANSTDQWLIPQINSTASQTPTITWTFSWTGYNGSMSTGIKCSDGTNLYDYPTTSGVSHTQAWPVNATWCRIYAWANGGGNFTSLGGSATYRDPAVPVAFAFLGTGSSDVKSVVLFDGAAMIAGDSAPASGTTYRAEPRATMSYGTHAVAARSFDAAGNSSTASAALPVTIVEYLQSTAIGVSTQTTVGAETWAVVRMLDEAGQPISTYAGTVSITTDDATAVFPDGNTYAFAGLADETGTNVRVLFGAPGPHTLSVTGQSIVPSTSDTTTVAVTNLTATAPPTVYQNIRFVLNVRPHDTTNHLITGYAARTTFSSSDGTAFYGPEVDATTKQYTFTCACDNGHNFAASLGTLGSQTITVTDQFGNTDTVTVDVVAAPSAIPNPFTVYAVQWNHGNFADFYIDPGGYNQPYTVNAVESRCNATGSELEGVTSTVHSFAAGRGAMSTDAIQFPDCGNINTNEANLHTLFVTDGAGHQWAVTPSARYRRFTDMPGYANFTARDPGDPINTMTELARSATPIIVKPSSEPMNKVWKYVPGGNSIVVSAYEPTKIFSVSFRTDIIADFDKGIQPMFQMFDIHTGSQGIFVDDIQWACWFGARYSNGIRFTYASANGRRGIYDFGLLPATSDSQAWCQGDGSSSMGASPPPNEKPVYHDLFDDIRQWLETDPVDPSSGGFTQTVTDFDIGGLSPGLALARHYDSQLAEASAAGSAEVPASTLFGRGWVSSLDWQLADMTNGTGKVLYATGMKIQFTQNSDGSYSAAGGTYKLAAISGGFKVSDLEGAGRRFNSAGRQVAIVDQVGRELTLTYDGAGKLASFADPAGRTAIATTNAAGHVTRVDLPDGRYVAFTYNAAGTMTSSRTLDGQTLTIVADTRGRITSLKDVAGHVLVTNVYDGKGRVFRQTDALGNPSFLAYNPKAAAPVTRVVSPRGGVMTDCFGAYGSSLTGRVDQMGGVRGWTYDILGHPASATDELGAVTNYVYDVDGRVTKVTDQDGRSMTVAYNAGGRISAMADSTGASVTTTFDPTSGLPISITQSKGANSFVSAAYTYDPVTKLPRLISGPTGTGTGELQYDSRGYISASIDSEGRKTTIVTNARGFITSVVSPEGNAAGGNPALYTTSYTYDDMGRVLTVTGPLNKVVTYTYDEFGRTRTVTTPLGFVTTYNYNLRGDLFTVVQEVTASTTATTTYEYDADGNVTAVIDPDNRRQEYTYDLANRAISIKDATNKSWATQYDAAGHVIASTDPLGRNVSTTYDVAGRIKKTTDAAGKDTTFTYTFLDQLETVTDPLNHTTAYGYDWRGRLTTLTNAKLEVTAAGYDDAGRVTSVTNARNKTTAYEYDLTGLLRKVIEPGTINTLYTYDAAGRLKTRTNDRGAVETYEYDRAGRAIKLTDAATKLWQTFYDDDGRVDHTIDGKGQTTQFSYDRANRLLTSTPSAGPATTYAYDLSGRMGSAIDGNGTSAFGYDPTGRLTSVVRAGRTLQYTYNEAGQRTSVIYPAAQGNVSYGYDTAGRLQTVTDWASRTTTYGYDDASRATTINRPGGLLTTIGYDVLDRASSVTHARSGTNLLVLGYTYDAAGNLATYTDDTGTATFGYDDLNRLASAAYPGGQAYAYTYDNVGNILTNSTPAGSRSYTYDLADRITSAGPAIGGGPGSSTKAPTSNNNGWTASQNAYVSDNQYATAAPGKNMTTSVRVGTFGFNASIPANATITGVTVSVEWKATSGSVATLGSQVYAGGVAKGTELTNSSPPTSDTTQTYTVSGLTRANLLDGTFEVNVRASRGNSNTAFTASLNSVSVKVDYTTPPVGAAPTYDDNGNMLSDGTYGNRSFTYDALGRLTGVTGNGVTTFALDGAGNRWAETVSGATTNFDLDLSSAAPAILADGSHKYLPGAPAAGYEQAGTWYSGLTDAHGSLLGSVSQAGTLSTLAHYDPYGSARPGSSVANGIGFTGEWMNATGLVNLRFRQYDPVMGRFIGRDTFAGVASAPQSGNRYSFGNGNPLTAADPSGHFNNHLVMPERAFISMAVSFAGPVGLVYMAASGIMGYDPIAGVSLTPEERVAAVAPVVVVGAIAKIGSKLAGLAERAAVAERLNAERAAVVDAERAIAEASKAAAVGTAAREGAAVGVVGREAAVAERAAPGLERSATAWAAESSSAKPLQAGEAGRFSELRARGVSGDQLTPHHIPQAAAARTGYSEGGALVLPQSEHVLTRTYGAKGAAAVTADASLTFRQVLARDIWDIKLIAGSRYNAGLSDLVGYYRTNFPELILKVPAP